jgi:glycerol-3-phosphate acyltransferase PlsX
MAPSMPTKTGGKVVICDCGANAECTPEFLLQFGVVGSLYAKKTLNVANPKVGLLNIGTEDTKGGTLQLEAYKLLQESPINFVGNVEARDVPTGVCDAVIADGFTGNVALKLYEGVAMTLMKMIKEMFLSSLKTKIAAVLAKSKMYDLKKKMDYSEVGGAPLLGVKKPVIKAHGSSNANAIKNAIRQAKLCVENDVVGKITTSLATTAQAEVD